MGQGATSSSTVDAEFRRPRILDGGNVPASSSASGKPGELAWDSSYMYVCTAVNTWKRITLASY
jgi:hypothetical protein